ncbi:M48 family metallopeptidase [Glaciecola sp. MH2013]|uniref:beta-barrel assembly-enhancing protease n=1 Tax=Glaciecola sp. MH2013 TaxID=2785524 RepID=UPI00189D330A|nr:M48 family metalloprotease [Glaciecola sp. MH2013]MBF7072875.1 M48 family metallopeptidase [Glaciecola sp. MH2013]
MSKYKVCKRLIIALVAALPFAIGAQSSDINKNQLPEIGVVASDTLTIEKELLVGKAIMRQLRGQAPIIHDPVLNEYIQDLGNKLVIESDNAKFPFTFFTLNNPTINAFAFFGGHIGIHSGLITQADTESELASVFAHEIAHVTQRHLARSSQAQKRSAPLQIASLIGGILLAMANPEAGIAAISAGNAGAAQSRINYTRSMEQEADNIGISMLARAGFDPKGAPAFFGKLAVQARGRSNELAFLQTHPIPENRISETRARASTYGDRRIAPSLNFQLAKARIIARYEGNAQRNINYFAYQLQNQNYVLREAAMYGLALSYFDAESYASANQLLSELLANDNENLFYLDALTDVLIAQDTPDKAIELLKPIWQLKPKNKVLSLNLANAMIKNQDFAPAIQILRDILLVEPEHYLSYSLLVDAYRGTGQKREMYKANAEIYGLVLAYPQAIDELNFAYNETGEDFLEKQRIKARIEQFRSQMISLERL